MHIDEIVKGLENGTVTVDKNKHKLTDVLNVYSMQSSFLSRMVAEYEAKIAGTKPLDKFDKKRDLSKSLALYKSQQEIEVGKYPISISFESAYCFDCGRNLRPILMPGNVIKLIDPSVYNTLPPNGEWSSFILKDEHFDTCELYPTRQKGYVEAEIEVPTGNFIFANRFHGEAFEDTRENEHHRTGSINSILGATDFMQFNAKNDVIYCSMSNMGVAVYVNDAGDDVIISTDYGYDEETDEEYRISFKGYTCLGKFHCATWCWMGGDIKTLTAMGVERPEIPKKPTPKNGKGRDVIHTKLTAGRWSVKHYFQFMDTGHGFHRHDEDVKPDRNPIYSRFSLIR